MSSAQREYLRVAPRPRQPGAAMADRNQMLNGGQVIVDYLIREKVPYAFGLCGHGNIGFIDALYERSDEIKTISVHHETVAGFMADVYYRVGGRPTAMSDFRITDSGMRRIIWSRIQHPTAFEIEPTLALRRASCAMVRVRAARTRS